MKPVDFQYQRPSSLQDALGLMSAPDQDVAALAGGQSLMPMLNFRIAAPDVLVDLSGVAELSGIEVTQDKVRFGAMTRYSDMLALREVSERLPLVAKALPYIAHSAIRNRGTLGGSLALADPAAEMPAVMRALGAQIIVAGPDAERTVGADDFFLGYYETALQKGELITAIDIPAATPGARFGFCEIARRHGDYAMAGVAIAAGGPAPRIAFFGVSDRAVRATAAETILGEDPMALDDAIAALSEIDFAGDLNASDAMKQHLAGVVLKRAWAEVLP